MNKAEFENVYWKQYIELEKELIDIGKYISFDKDNFSTHSLMLQKFILEVGSEIDNVMKEISGLAGEERSNIVEYYSHLIEIYPKIINQGVKINEIVLKPFAKWSREQPAQSLTFWQDYNAIKHNRYESRKIASLKNAITSLAALFILEVYEIDRKYKEELDAFSNMPENDYLSKIFVMEDWGIHMRSKNVQSDYSIVDDDTGDILIDASTPNPL